MGATSRAPAPSSPAPNAALCSGLKADLGRAIITQKHASDTIAQLVATLSDYAVSVNNRESTPAYKDAMHALDVLSELEKTNAQLKHQLALAAAEPGSADPQSAGIAAALGRISDDETSVAQQNADLLNEWYADAMLNVNAAPISHSGGRGKGNPFSGFGVGGATVTAISVMEVRPLLLQTVRRMDDVAAQLQAVHPAIEAGIRTCFSRARRQATGP